ncbi:14-3-3 domain [Cystoisospora suis]|uniref:14-3-3 domain n=1 Tax=Cystoisospora suis TaxID=483139 RepID=A0A2C6KQH9_9APIC|nr:14-3-3 domain [Cystoisospora suis]
MVVLFMKKVVETGEELNDEERNLLSVGYKNIVGGFRTSWRSLALIEQRELEAGTLRLDLLTNYRRRLELQLQNSCDEVTRLIDQHLLPSASTVECKAFYLKMKADYCRYMSEVAQVTGACALPLVDALLSLLALAVANKRSETAGATSSLSVTRPGDDRKVPTSPHFIISGDRLRSLLTQPVRSPHRSRAEKTEQGRLASSLLRMRNSRALSRRRRKRTKR